eukprot:15337916-Ditylum_brightwellii.AAC.1
MQKNHQGRIQSSDHMHQPPNANQTHQRRIWSSDHMRCPPDKMYKEERGGYGAVITCTTLLIKYNNIMDKTMVRLFNKKTEE